MLGPVDLRRPQIGAEQVIAAEDVERQEAVVVVVAVEETLLLMAVDAVVGGVEVEDDLLRRRRVSREEHVDEDLGHPPQRLLRDAVLQPAKRRRRGQRGIALDLGMLGRELPERIVAEVLVVVEVFVARREGEDPLSQQTALRMRDQARIPRIGNGVRSTHRSGRVAGRPRAAAGLRRRR